jgi:hypothetical protein
LKLERQTEIEKKKMKKNEIHAQGHYIQCDHMPTGTISSIVNNFGLISKKKAAFAGFSLQCNKK